MPLASQEEQDCVHCQGLEGISAVFFNKQLCTWERTNPHTQNNNEEHTYFLDSGHSYVLLEKLMSIDMLNINYSLLEAEISNSYCEGNSRHGYVATITFAWYVPVCTAI